MTQDNDTQVDVLDADWMEAAMRDLSGMRHAANFAGDVYEMLSDIQTQGFDESFAEIEDQVDDYIGSLSEPGVILCLAYRVRELEAALARTTGGAK